MMVRRLAIWMTVCIVAAHAPSAFAQVRIQPMRVFVNAQPGAQFDLPFEIINQSRTEPAVVTIDYRDVRQAQGTRLMFPDAGDTAYSFAGWMTDTLERVEIEAGGSREIRLRGRVPRGERGTRHGAIIVTPEIDERPADAMTVRMPVQVAILVDIALPGRNDSELTITELSLDNAAQAAPTMAPEDVMSALRQKVAATVTYENESATAGWVRGYVYLRSIATGRIVARTAIASNPRGIRVLPQSSVRAVHIFEDGVPAGDYTLEVKARYGDRGRRLEAVADFQMAGMDDFLAISEMGAASERFTLTVSPGQLDLPFRPGIPSTKTIVAANGEDQPMVCKAEVLNFTMEPDGTIAQQPLDEGTQVSIQPAEFTLPARGSTRLTVQVRPGEMLSPRRQHYWMAQVTGKPEGADEAAVAIGSTVLVASDPRQVQPAAPRLVDVSVQQGLSETRLSLTVKNAGGTHYLTDGRIEIAEMTEDGASFSADLPSSTILAQSQRVFHVPVARSLSDHAWLCTLRLKLDDEDLEPVSFRVHPAASGTPAEDADDENEPDEPGANTGDQEGEAAPE